MTLLLPLNNKTFQCIHFTCVASSGLDIHDGSSPVLVKNVYKRDTSRSIGAGAGAGLKFDIVKVKGRAEAEVEELGDTEVISVTEDSDEVAVVAEIMRSVTFSTSTFLF